MALFKIEKGLAAALEANRPNTIEGYCYVTTDDGKFYIDTATATGTDSRIVLNAGTADHTKGTLTLQANGETIGTFNGEDSVINIETELFEPLVLTEGVSYGDTLPAEGENGQLFFLAGDDVALPNGGDAGQVLTKQSAEDGDAIWADVQGLPEGGTAGQVLIKNSSTEGDASWGKIVALPTGGSAGQVLAKNSATDGDAGWISPRNNFIAYATCVTAAATAAKVATIQNNSNWKLEVGSIVMVKFSATNTAQNPTLNVGGTGAKSIWYNTALITTGNLWVAGSANIPQIYMYDGTQYVWIGRAIDANTTNYLPLTGGTVTGQITLKNTTATPTKGQILPALNVSYQNGAGTYYSGSVIDMVGTENTSETYNLSVRLGSPSGTTIISSGESGKTMPAAVPLADDEHIYLVSDGSIIFYPGAANDAASYTKALTVAKTRIDSHVAFYGAVYNDYAEFREAYADPGRCVVENGDGALRLSYKRLEPAPEIISDTFGFAIGETEKCKAPIAVAGRVLAYPYEPKEEFKAGDPVCSGPDGTISKMTREEVCMYPDRIIGTVSEIPTYDTWGQDNIIVDGRIWIRIR